MAANSRQRVRSCVVKPPQPRWFFSSSNTFSASARSRYSCPRVRISLSSEVTRAAYSPDRLIRPDLGKPKPQLRRVCVVGDPQVAGQFATQQNDPAVAAPAAQPQAGLLALPALPGIRPI